MIRQIFILACAAVFVTGCVSGGYNTIEHNPKAAEINMRLGLGYLKQGSYELANTKLSRALQQAPELAETNWAFAVLQETIDHPEEAQKYYRKALRLSPDAPDILNGYGSFLCKQGKVQSAYTQFEKVAQNKLYPKPETALNNAGVCALKNKDPKTAERYFRRALKANPTYASPLYQMALIAFNDKRYLASRAYRERLGQVLSRPDPKVLYLCAKTEERLGNRVEAARCARKLKSEFPSTEEARSIY
ncbi:MAG: type IV pilus biogenesis/stability protein PilW [bacterium]